MKNTKFAANTDSTSRRLAERDSEFLRAKTLHEGLSRRGGSYSVGMDENGAKKETRSISGFPIIIDRWYVRMGFKYEDKEKIKDESWLEVEARLKSGNLPRRLVKFDTHIITAVRALKHVRQSYQQELASTDALLNILDEANLKLASVKRNHSNKELEEAIGKLKLAQAELSKKEVAIKRVVAVERIKSALEKLENSLSMPQGSKRDMEVSRACAVFVSVRNRLGSWRDKQVAGLVEYNLQKECSLRMERDRWLLSQISRFAESTESVHKFSLLDLQKIEVLEKIRKMLKGKPNKENILAFMKKNHELFRVSQRQREYAEQMIALAESGIKPRVGINVDYLIGHYAMLYRHVMKSEKPKAIQRIDYLEIFVKANKPSFVLDELGKDPDLYLGPVLEPLASALNYFESSDLIQAKKFFYHARDAMRSIVSK